MQAQQSLARCIKIAQSKIYLIRNSNVQNMLESLVVIITKSSK